MLMENKKLQSLLILLQKEATHEQVCLPFSCLNTFRIPASKIKPLSGNRASGGKTSACSSLPRRSHWKAYMDLTLTLKVL